EHPGAGLPAVADLATDRAAIRIVAAFAARQERRNRRPAAAAGAPTAVDADVEAPPVIHGGNHRRSLGVRASREIGRGGRSDRAERDQAGRDKQNLFHFSRSNFFYWPPRPRDVVIAVSVQIAVTSLQQALPNASVQIVS